MSHISNYYARGVRRILARYRRMYPDIDIDYEEINYHAHKRHNHEFVRRLGGQK